MLFFDQYPEFVQQDTRRSRGFSPVTADSLSRRHQASLPGHLVQGQTVLDLGCCIGATGHWTLAHGAQHYTGIEAQNTMVDTARELLAKHWSNSQFSIIHSDIRSFLQNTTGKKYDLVVATGIIYAFLDTYSLLDEITQVCKNILVIDCIYPWYMTNPDWPIIDVTLNQNINSDQEGQSYSGAGCRISPAALRIIMNSLNFTDREGLIHPEPSSDPNCHDSYNTPIERLSAAEPWPARYLMRFYRGCQSSVRPVSEHVVNNNVQALKPMPKRPRFDAAESWTFDHSVAQRFGQEAHDHIPDYERVIDLSLATVDRVFDSRRDISVVDVGSAVGYTLDRLINLGYTHVQGLESSSSMKAQSLHADRVILSNHFSLGPVDAVLANWTLHFIPDREQYLADIYDQLCTNGLLIITDKMSHDSVQESLYYDFKRANGVPEEIIQKKKQALTGVLTTRPLSWYLSTLEKLNFQDIQVINSRLMFTTIYARKY